MNGRNRIWFLAFLLAMPAAVAVGSGKTEASTGPAAPVSISYWHTYSDAEEKLLLEQVKPMFEKANPGIVLDITRMPYEGLKQQVITAVAGGTPPDLMRMDIIWVPEFAKMGALLKLSDRPGFDKIKASVFQGPLDTNAYNGAFYGVPLNTNTKVAVYNKDVLALAGLTTAPATMDDLVKAARALKDKGKYGIGIAGPHAWGILPYFWSLGGRLTNDDYTQIEGHMNSPESIRALQTMVQWQKDGLIAPAFLGGQPSTWDGMKDGTYLMIDDGPWFFSILIGDKNSTFDVMGKTIRALIPTGPGGSHSVVGGENLVIFQGSKKPEQAWTFATWMLGVEPQLIIAKSGLVPTNREAAAKVNMAETPYIAEFVKQLETALPRTPIPQWGEMETIFNLAAEKAFRGEAEPKAALDAAARQAQALLGK